MLQRKHWRMHQDWWNGTKKHQFKNACNSLFIIGVRRLTYPWRVMRLNDRLWPYCIPIWVTEKFFHHIKFVGWEWTLKMIHFDDSKLESDKKETNSKSISDRTLNLENWFWTIKGGFYFLIMKISVNHWFFCSLNLNFKIHYFSS